MENTDQDVTNPAHAGNASGWIVLIDLEILLHERARGDQAFHSLKHMLEELSHRYSLCLLASKEDVHLADILLSLEDWGLDQIFPERKVVCANQLKYPIHDPQSFHVAAALAGGRPECCILACSDLPAFREAAKEENRLLRAMGLSVEDKFRVLLDNELEESDLRRPNLESSSPGSSSIGSSSIGSSSPESSSLESSLLEAVPLEIDWSKMTEKVDLDELIVDGPSYWDRLDLQANISDGLRQALKNAYGR